MNSSFISKYNTSKCVRTALVIIILIYLRRRPTGSRMVNMRREISVINECIVIVIDFI